MCHRDNLGVGLQQIIVHSLFLTTLVHLRTYMKDKGNHFYDDGSQDIFDVFHPMLVLSVLFIVRIVCCRLETALELTVAIGCLYGALFVGYCSFDKPQSNVHEYSPPCWHLAVPIAGILICEAWINVKEYWFIDDLKRRIFFHSDVPLKRFFVGAHMLASVVYSAIMIFYLVRTESDQLDSKVETA